MDNTFTAKLRSDKRKKPEMKEYRFLSFDECKQLSSWDHPLVIDRFHNIVSVKITSIKTWKTRPEVEIRWKYGLYEYGSEMVYPDRQQEFFVIEV